MVVKKTLEVSDVCCSRLLMIFLCSTVHSNHVICCTWQHQKSESSGTRQMWTDWLPITPASGSVHIFMCCCVCIYCCSYTRVILSHGPPS